MDNAPKADGIGHGDAKTPKSDQVFHGEDKCEADLHGPKEISVDRVVDIHRVEHYYLHTGEDSDEQCHIKQVSTARLRAKDHGFHGVSDRFGLTHGQSFLSSCSVSARPRQVVVVVLKRSDAFDRFA